MMMMMNNYYECGACLTLFKEHDSQTDYCSLCYDSMLSLKDMEDVFVDESDYALEVESDLSFLR